MNQKLKDTIKDIVQSGTATPFYFYDTELLRATLEAAVKAYQKYGFVVHYALKANSHHEVLKMTRHYLQGADCVSGNEVQRAVDAGFDPGGIVFAGVGKSDAEIDLALRNDIFCFNCESEQELEVIQERALIQCKKARIALRINPGVDAQTHHYITTGLEENKFGINMWELESITEKLKHLPNLQLTGLHFHIGSQITRLDPFKSLCLRVNEISDWFVSKHIPIQHINVGGGLGINYHHPDQEAIPDFEAYFQLFHRFLQLRPGQQLHFELGRAIVGQCGSLVSKVLYIKKGLKTNFAILDAGMTELIRPALYQSYHSIENISKNDQQLLPYDVVGPICESSDCFGKAVFLPATSRGDIVVIRSTGAYGEVMASHYNLRDTAPSIFAKD
ncbi:MAG: diaminopimelate decarboxylase [Bacteroidetes bacterium]|nr:MAG: diaminopimelate decarboxylase [Bacteroidota bacterium]